MLDHAITFKDLVESRQRTTAIDHVIFRDDLEPVDCGLLFEDVGVMRNPQTDADPVIHEPVKSIGWHMYEQKGPAQGGDGPLEGFLFGAVSGASALTLAGVLAPLLLGSAT